MTTRVKVFTSIGNPRYVSGGSGSIGDNITQKIDNWIDSKTEGIQILSVESTLNENIYSIVVVYSEPEIRSFEPKNSSDSAGNQNEVEEKIPKI